jgi:SPP1 family predicted phage head-tail adaptor
MAVLGAGARKQRITLQQRAPGQDALGQESTSWVNLALNPTVWAMAKPARGSENFADGQMQARADVVFNIRYRADVTSLMRVLWRGQPYEITSTSTAPRRTWN